MFYDGYIYIYMAVCQNLVPLVNIKIAGKWMFIPLKMVLIGIDPYPYIYYYIIINSMYMWNYGMITCIPQNWTPTRPEFSLDALGRSELNFGWWFILGLIAATKKR